MSKLKIDFFSFGLGNPVIDAWFGGMYRSFFEALESLGCEVSHTMTRPNADADVLVVSVGGGQDKLAAQAMRSFGGPVIMNVGAAGYWFRAGFLLRWRSQILFVYGTDHSEWSPNRFAELGIRYHYMPFASNPAIMRPLNLPRIYDVVFVGNARSGAGRERYTDPLFNKLDPAKSLFVGPGWERYSFPNQHIAWGPLLNLVYNLGHICINISNDEQKVVDGARGFQRLDANNRLFDLAMAGCFQISNAPQIVRRYFDESEVIAVDKPDEWVAAICHYLKHPEQVESFCIRARERALAGHTWENRAKAFVHTSEELFPRWSSLHNESGRWQEFLQMRDLILPPGGINDLMARVNRKVGSFAARTR